VEINIDEYEKVYNKKHVNIIIKMYI